MGAEPLTGRETLLVFLAAGITIILIVSAASIHKQEYWSGIAWLTLGASLAFAFFRKRKIIFAIVALTFILINAGLTAMVRPSFLGVLLTSGAAAGLYLIIRWHTRKVPNLGRKDMHKLFDGDQQS